MDTLNLSHSLLRRSNHAHSHACDVMQEEREDSKNIVPVQAMMGDGRVEIKFHSFLTSALQRSGNITPCQLYLQEKQPAMHHIRGWVWSGDTLDISKIRKRLLPLLGVKVVLSDPPAPSLVTVQTERSCLLGKRVRTVLTSDSSAEHFYGFHGKLWNKWIKIWISAKNSNISRNITGICVRQLAVQELTTWTTNELLRFCFHTYRFFRIWKIIFCAPPRQKGGKSRVRKIKCAGTDRAGQKKQCEDTKNNICVHLFYLYLEIHWQFC